MTDALIAPFPPLTVKSDPVAMRKLFQPNIVLLTSLAVGAAIAAAASAALMASVAGFAAGFAASLPFLVIVVFASLSAAQTANTAAERITAGSLVSLDAFGLSSTLAQGTVSLPWHTIESVSLKKRGRHRVLTYRIAAGVSPETAGVETTLAPGGFALLNKRGFQLGSAGIDTPIQTIADATAAFTAGRLLAR
ncbi:asparagine N-glycosylation enzyme membrane subunit Stt3 [Mycetocola sp. CAN_C7]|uniref:hypothetical protein n=1 Tax=Mycetocola sp. CAN_C7 TaxID=2787724 RepID=UPI0018CB50F8